MPCAPKGSSLAGDTHSKALNAGPPRRALRGVRWDSRAAWQAQLSPLGSERQLCAGPSSQHTAAGLPAQSTLETTQGRGKAQPQLSWARAEVWVGESPRPTTKLSRTHHLALQKHKTNSQRGFSAPGTFSLPLLQDNDTGTGLSLVRAALGLTVFHVLFL